MDIRANYGKIQAMGIIYTSVFNSAHTEVNRRVLLYEITWIFFFGERRHQKAQWAKKPHVNANMKLLEQQLYLLFMK